MLFSIFFIENMKPFSRNPEIWPKLSWGGLVTSPRIDLLFYRLQFLESFHFLHSFQKICAVSFSSSGPDVTL